MEDRGRDGDGGYDAGGPGREIWLLGGLTLVTVAGNTSVTLAQPDVARAFGAGPADVGWIVFGYSAAFAVGAVVFGYLGRILPLERALGSGIAIFGVASVLAAFSPNLLFLIGTRILQGLGAGAIPPLSASLVAGRLPEAQRPRGLGIIVAGVASGLALAPIIAGIALDLVGWQPVVALGVLAIPGVRYLFSSAAPSSRSGGVDLIGIGLVAVGGFSAAYFVNRILLSGLTVATATTLLAAAAATGILVHRSLGQANGSRRRPILPAAVLRSSVFAEVAALGAIGMSVFIGSIVLVPLVAEDRYGVQGLGLGALYLPMGVTAAGASLWNGAVQARIGQRATTALALLLLSAGAMAQALVGFREGPIAQALVLPILGAGFGLLSAPLLNRLTSVFGGLDRPPAVGTYNLCYFLGGALGGAVATGIVQAQVAFPLIPAGPIRPFIGAELILAAAPLVAAVLVGVRASRGGKPSVSGQ